MHRSGYRPKLRTAVNDISEPQCHFQPHQPDPWHHPLHKSVDGSSNTPISLAASLAALVRYRRLTASLSDSHNMEGSQALGKPNLRRKLPLLAVSMFLVGMGLETAMCLSGFYSVYTVNEAKRKAEEEVREEEFWQRVRDRRAARQAAVTISSEE
ncbi:putative transmembrane protein [Toxoplasma gondii MAS]|uniref:Putative transmembrane protein n=1 Tax=Toxoplasma gondii MAS TaxID=943118 RepID=A0A086QFV4_TOXGO|nr:putative transmembrane protein [Toxoplasma gondii MAS]